MAARAWSAWPSRYRERARKARSGGYDEPVPVVLVCPVGQRQRASGLFVPLHAVLGNAQGVKEIAVVRYEPAGGFRLRQGQPIRCRISSSVGGPRLDWRR